MLQSQINDRTTERRVLRAARALLGKRKGVCVFYEHGHWWAKHDTGEQTRCYDIVDAEGRHSFDGFALEAV